MLFIGVRFGIALVVANNVDGYNPEQTINNEDVRVRKLTAFFFLIFSISSVPAIAGGGHDHEHGHKHHDDHAHDPVSADTASHKAMKKVAQLAKRGKIDASWEGIKPSSVEQKTFAKGDEWVVVFENEKVTDQSKQTLYLFYSLEGHYIAANYSGE